MLRRHAPRLEGGRWSPHARPVCPVQLCLRTGLLRRASPGGSGGRPIATSCPTLPRPRSSSQRRSPWTSQALGGWPEGFRGKRVQPLVQAAAVVWVDGVGLGKPRAGPQQGRGQGPGAGVQPSEPNAHPCLVWAHLARLPPQACALVPLDSAPLRPELASQLLRDTLLLHRPHPHPQLPRHLI